jgi:dCMP deaminase
MKRKDYLSWEEYFMGLALLSAERSKDPKTQVGACIIDSNKKIISVGYNGAPTGFNDDLIPWDTDAKHLYVCHAELNAILNAGKSLENCTLFVTLFPCNECAKIIIQSGIKEVIYLNDKNNVITKEMFDICGVKYRKYRKKAE